MPAAADTSALVHQLLSDRTYHIEFGGYLTNHVKHAIVALHGLDAPANVIQRYWDEYTKLTPYGLRLTPAESPTGEPVTRETWRSLLGSKERFPDLHNFFAHELQRLGTEAFVREYAPQLAPGAAAALTHGIIHFGWGLDADNAGMIAEGAAYMAYTFVDIKAERFVADANDDDHPIASLARILKTRASEEYRSNLERIKADEKYSERSGFHPELVQTGLQWNIAKVIEEGSPLFLELPRWLCEGPVDTVLEQLHRAFAALHLAAAASRNDTQAPPADESRDANFVVLHLITSLWGLDRVLPFLADDATKRLALQCFWASAIAVLVTTDAVVSERALTKVWAEFGAIEPEKSGSSEQKWQKEVQRAWKEMEEHNIKLVYVERALRDRYGEWPGWLRTAETFTETPAIGPGREAFSA